MGLIDDVKTGFVAATCGRASARLRLAALAAMACALLAVAGSGFVLTAGASPVATVVVKPSSMHGWYFWNDKQDQFTGSPGSLVSGPATPPLENGSVRLGPLTDDGS